MGFSDDLARKALGDPTTSCEDLASIADSHPDLCTQVAAHPNADRFLLDWLKQSGDPEVVRIVVEREAAEPDIEPSDPDVEPSDVEPSDPESPSSVATTSHLDTWAPPEGVPTSPPEIELPDPEPEIGPDKREWRVWLIVVLVLALVGGGYLVYDNWPPPEPSEPTPTDISTPDDVDVRLVIETDGAVLTIHGASEIPDLIVTPSGEVYLMSPLDDSGSEGVSTAQVIINDKSPLPGYVIIPSDHELYEHVDIAPNGDIIISGYRDSDDNPGTFLLRQDSSQGQTTWRLWLDLSEVTWWNVVACKDSGFLSVGADLMMDQVIIARHSSTNDRLWLVDFGNDLEVGGYLVDVAEADDGSIYAVGYASVNPTITDPSGTYAVMTKLDPNGTILWKKFIGGEGFDRFTAVEVAPNGTIYAVGSTSSFSGDLSVSHGSHDAALAALDSDGNLLWTRTYGGSGIDLFNDLQISPDGRIIAVGTTEPIDGDFAQCEGNCQWSEDVKQEAVVASLEPDGALEWSARMGITPSVFLAVTLAPSGNIYAAGYSYYSVATLLRLAPDGTPVPF